VEEDDDVSFSIRTLVLLLRLRLLQVVSSVTVTFMFTFVISVPVDIECWSSLISSSTALTLDSGNACREGEGVISAVRIGCIRSICFVIVGW